jgi:3-oxoacyl-[acyl-carrier-protein] synthase-1
MVTAVGYSSAQTCTALFAGVSAFEEFEGVVDCAGGSVVCAALPPPARNQLGDRLTSAAWAAMEEAMDDAQVPSGVDLQVAFVTADPVRPGPAVAADTLEALAVERWGRSHDVRCQVVRAGNAGTANVLETLTSTGAPPAGAAALVVAYDSLCSFDALRHMEGAGRLKTRVRPRGAIPGEAAAAIVVETTSRFARPCYASIAGLGIATEPVPVGVDAPCLGDGLTRAIADALSGAGWQDATHLATYCDMNGEEYRAHEWMLGCSRCAGRSDSHEWSTPPIASATSAPHRCPCCWALRA